MFFGIAIENYLKGYLIKNNKFGQIISLNKNKQEELLGEIIKGHNLKKFYTKAFGIIDNFKEESLENLKRAIEGAKYSIEKMLKIRMLIQHILIEILKLRKKL